MQSAQDGDPTSVKRDRPDVEVTPEMIEAGLTALAWYDLAVDKGSLVVAEIYTAMEQERIRTVAGMTEVPNAD